MNEIHIARGGQRLGTFTVQQVRDGLGSGELLATDLAWHAGMTDWKPLGEFAEFGVSAGTGTGGAAQTGGGGVPPIISSAAGALDGPPWEHRGRLGIFTAFTETLKAVFLTPVATFSTMRKSGDFMSPVIYFIILGWAGMAFSLFYRVAWSLLRGAATGNMAAPFGSASMEIVFFILGPVLLLLAIFVFGGIFHLTLMAVGGTNHSFETTVRAYCYSCGSANMLSVVPFLGQYVAAIYGLVLLVIALARAHDTSYGKAAAAVLIPVLICCGVVFIGAVVMGVAIGAAAASAR